MGSSLADEGFGGAAAAVLRRGLTGRLYRPTRWRSGVSLRETLGISHRTWEREEAGQSRGGSQKPLCPLALRALLIILIQIL